MKVDDRCARIRMLPCIACTINQSKFRYPLPPQPSPSECHHLNLGGKAGQKRRGEEFTIPLCGWHHRGDPIDGMTASAMTILHGPSLSRQSKDFRLWYGKDEDLLEATDAKLGAQ